jgi:hypothetical protein
MNDNCLDIGIIQSYVDGELRSSAAETVLRHVSGCEACAFLVGDLESENELAFAALDTELNVLVPTERLRSKVFTSINEIESSRRLGIWGRFVSTFGISGMLARPSVAAFASVALFVGFAAVGIKYFSTAETAREIVSSNPNSDIGTQSVSDTQVNNTPASDGPITGLAPTTVDNSAKTGLRPPTKRAQRAPVYRNASVKTSRRPQTNRKHPIHGAKSTDNGSRNLLPTVSPGPSIASEDGYLTTIATLNRTVDESKDYVLRPSERVTYERDLAVVDDAIKKMRGEVKKNPNNSAAREVLRSSYKSKIDLLKSVADRSEVVASRD